VTNSMPLFRGSRDHRAVFEAEAYIPGGPTLGALEQGHLCRTQAAPIKPKQVWSIRLTLQREDRIHDLALFDLAIGSKLRGCDLVQLRIGQLVINAAARHRATIVQQKTEKPVQFELMQQTRESLIAWLTHRGGGLAVAITPILFRMSRCMVGS
jgi:integrase